MSIYKKLTAPALNVALGTIAAVSVAPAGAQQAELTEVETVVVTGSLLKRIDAEVALPVTVLSADDIAKAGATNAIDALQLVAQNQSTTISNTSAGSGSGFASYASLRSLGSARTLVLVNGRRVVNYPYQSLGVDLNTVPMVMVERVDVLTDGASSTYGSDAIAGVINYITRREMRGVTLSASTMQPEASGGGQTYQGSAGAGFGSLGENGWNVYAGASWRKFETLMGIDRDFTDTYRPELGFSRLNGTTFPANYSQQSAGLTAINPFSPQCSPATSVYGDGQFGPRSCAFDFSGVVPAIPRQEQWSAIAKGTVELGSHTASLEYIRGYSEVFGALAPAPLNGLTMTSNNPFYPGRGIAPGVTGLDPTRPVSVNWRLTAMGNPAVEVQSTTERLLGQLEGQVLNWDYQLFALSSESTATLDSAAGYVRLQSVRDGLVGANGAPFLNPFGEQSAAGQQFLLDNLVLGEAQRAEGSLTMFGVQFTREVAQLPAGALGLALAIEHKKEDAQFKNNFAVTRQAGGLGFELAQDIAGDRDSSAVAVEANVPVLRDLEMGLSVRYDDYSDFGDTVNPKVSLRYRPMDALLLRASYNTGFRAPTLYDLHAPENLLVSRSRSFDPVLCPGGVPNLAAGAVPTRDCNVQFNLLTAGSRDLEAEESAAYSVGFVLQPFAGVSFGVDYWDYDLTQTIGVLADSAVFADTLKYAGKIVRCSQTTAEQRALIAACRIAGGDPIAYIDSLTENLGGTRTSGFDITAQWSTRDTGFGRFGIDYRGTYVEKYQFQRERGGPFFSRNGEFIDGLPIIRYSHYATLRWEYGSWDVRLVNRHKSAYADCNQACVGNRPEFFRKVDAYSLWDMSTTFTAGNGLSITVGVDNLLDEDPPFTNKTSGIGHGWDERFVDPLGRSYMLLLTYRL